MTIHLRALIDELLHIHKESGVSAMLPEQSPIIIIIIIENFRVRVRWSKIVSQHVPLLNLQYALEILSGQWDLHFGFDTSANTTCDIKPMLKRYIVASNNSGSARCRNGTRHLATPALDPQMPQTPGPPLSPANACVTNRRLPTSANPSNAQPKPAF